MDQLTGSVNVLYYTTDGDQGVDDKDNDEVHVRLATSLDGGESFTYATMSRNTSVETDGHDGDYLEYIGLDVHGGTAHALWSSRVPGGGLDLEALYASAAMDNTSGNNFLTVTGEDDDDEIEIRRYADDTDYIEVLVNGDRQYAGLAATIDRIDIDGVTDPDDYVIDPNLGIPVAVLGPRVTSVVISKANTDADKHHDFSTANYLRRPVDGSGNQLRTVPVADADSVAIQFSQIPQNLTSGSLTLRSLTTGALKQLAASNGFQHVSGTTVATWKFDAALTADQYLITVSDAITGWEGNAFDGEWINPLSVNTTNIFVSEFPSGNRSPGGDFAFVFTILPGDANGTNAVDGGDLLVYMQNVGLDNRTFTQADYNGDGETNHLDNNIWLAHRYRQLLKLVFADFDGNGIVDDDDYVTVSENWGESGASHTDGDVDGDGDVDYQDYVIVQQQWGVVELMWVG